MSAPLVPSPLDYVGRRRFAFYPAVGRGHPNEWVLGKGSWAEVQVVNAQTGSELWIPRQYIRAVSEAYDLSLVVELTQELENVQGVMRPRVTRVIEMPHVETRRQFGWQRPANGSGPACVIGIRLETSEDSPMNKAVARLGIGALVVAILAGLTAAVSKL